MSEYNHAGERMGKCFGAFKLPYEVSCTANKQFRAFLEAQLQDLKATLEALQMSTFDVLIVEEYPHGQRTPVRVEHRRGTKQYERERELRIVQTESRIHSTENGIAYQTVKIDVWRAVALYGETTEYV